MKRGRTQSNILQLRAATGEEWARIWRECQYATYFHSHHWSEIWEAYSGGRLKRSPQLVSFTSGNQALLPMVLQSKVLRPNRVLSSPAGTYGGWIAADTLTREEQDSLVQRIIDTPGIRWRVNPLTDVALPGTKIKAEEETTQIIDLSSGRDELTDRWRRSNPSLFRKIRKARRNGIIVARATEDAEWEIYYHIYCRSLERWGRRATNRYHWKLFYLLAQRPAEEVSLWLAKLDGNPIAGAICLSSRYHTAYWHGAALEEYFRLRPANLLLSEIALDCAARSQRWFDLMPSGGHKGVEAFKRSFGTRELSTPYIRSPCLPGWINV